MPTIRQTAARCRRPVSYTHLDVYKRQVEDDAVIASAVQRHLESWGYQVACAVRFDDVLADFAAFDPQLVLLDISLPFFNGYH